MHKTENIDLLQLSIEDINFQSNNFFNELSLEVKKLYEKWKDTLDYQEELSNSQELLNISLLIKKYTNLNVKININNLRIIAAYLPFITRNHIFSNYEKKIFNVNDSFENENEVRQVSSILNKWEGSVDLNNAKVDGIFKEIECIIELDLYLLFSKGIESNNTSSIHKEIAAIILHEIGHMFTCFEFLDRSTSTNNVLQFISNVKKSNFTFEQKKIFIKDTISNLKDEDVERLVNSPIEEQLAIIYLGLEKQKSISQLGNDIYDLVGCEQIADNFTTKFGAGKYLAIALEKYEKYFSFNPYIPIGIYSVFLTMILGPVNIISAVFTSVMLFALSSISAFITNVFSHDNINRYDDLETRINRIINVNVERMKNKEITEELKSILLDENKVMREILNRNKSRKPLFKIVKEFFSKKTKKDADFIKLQKDLENIAANKLFEKATELSLLK